MVFTRAVRCSTFGETAQPSLRRISCAFPVAAPGTTTGTMTAAPTASSTSTPPSGRRSWPRRSAGTRSRRSSGTSSPAPRAATPRSSLPARSAAVWPAGTTRTTPPCPCVSGATRAPSARSRRMESESCPRQPGPRSNSGTHPTSAPETAGHPLRRTALKALGKAATPRARRSEASGIERRTFYDRKRAEGKRHKQAVIALTRRRVNVLWALIRDRRLYETAPPQITG